MSRLEGQRKRRRSGRNGGSNINSKVYASTFHGISSPDNLQCRDQQWASRPRTRKQSRQLPLQHGSAPTHIHNPTHSTVKGSSGSVGFPAHPTTALHSQRNRNRTHRVKSDESVGISTHPRTLRLSVTTTLPRVRGARLSGWRTRSRGGCEHEISKPTTSLSSVENTLLKI
jgi:hypothetical protein